MSHLNMCPARGDVEQAKKQYLAQWVHRGCGGAPVAYVENGKIGCTYCRAMWDGSGTLGAAVARIKDMQHIAVL